MVEKSIRADEGTDAFFSPSCTCSTEQGSVCCSGSPQPCPRLVQVFHVWGQTWSATANAALRCTGRFLSKAQDQESSPGPSPSTLEQASSKMGHGLSLLHTSTELYKPSTNPASTPWLLQKVPLQYLDITWKEQHLHPACQIQLEFTTACTRHGSRTGTHHTATKPEGSCKFAFL